MSQVSAFVGCYARRTGVDSPFSSLPSYEQLVSEASVTDQTANAYPRQGAPGIMRAIDTMFGLLPCRTALRLVRVWINPYMCYIITNTLSISKQADCAEFCHIC